MIESFTDAEVEDAFDVLLTLLPNDGKLYKYRSIEKEAFDNYYKALEEGYLWIPPAETLNDDFDTILRFDPLVEAEHIRDYLLANPGLYVRALLRYDDTLKIGFDERDHKAFDKVIKCYDLDTGELIKPKAIRLLGKMGIDALKATKYVKQVEEYVDYAIHNNEDALKSVVDNYMNINSMLRHNFHVFSMADSYQSNQMWALYANNNRGFCIEYDFTKGKTLSIDKKKLLINTFRVFYNDQPEQYSFVNLLKWILTGKKDKKLLRKANNDVCTQLMTKQAGWEFEQEWRVMLAHLDDNRVYLDLVSGIIIDERVMQTEEAKQLIHLCRKKGWSVILRKTQFANAVHTYEDI